MKKEEIIDELKAQYPRDLRKQLVKTILSNEKEQDKTAIEQRYNLMNQIFSYVLKECNWSMSKNSENWDNTPLEIMAKVFPKLETTQWYKEQDITVKKNIDIVIGQDR
jgi:DNA-binding ferritin-like protein